MLMEVPLQTSQGSENHVLGLFLLRVLRVLLYGRNYLIDTQAFKAIDIDMIYVLHMPGRP
jgi:hypothetical protein